MAHGWPRRRAGRRGVTLGTAVLAAALLAGCTGDTVSELGSGLPLGPGFDTLLVPLLCDTLAASGQLTVTDAGVPYDSLQVLYCGRDGTQFSSILARYDFTDPVDTIPAGGLTAETVARVTVRLYRCKPYRRQAAATDKGLVKRYWAEELADTLDASRYPGPEPAVLPGRLGSVEGLGGTFEIPVAKGRFLEWYAAGTHTGLRIAEADSIGSEAGLVGFASRELKIYTELDLLNAETVVGPVLKVYLTDDSVVRFLPRVDLSTLSQFDPLPASAAEGLVLRTQLRSYPYLGFSLARLPQRVVINRALLTLTADTTRALMTVPADSVGNVESVVVCEATAAALPDGGATLALDDLPERLQAVTGMSSVDPSRVARMTFDVTAVLQRWANGAYAQPLRLVVLAGEDFLDSYDATAYDPDFYYTRFWFKGTAAPDPADRPRLLIHYTPRAGRDGGAP